MIEGVELAPTDDAFAQLPANELEALLADPQQLEQMLLYPILPGEVPAQDLIGPSAIDTVLAEPLSLRRENGATWVNEARIIGNNIKAANGMIHVVNQLLWPPDDQPVE